MKILQEDVIKDLSKQYGAVTESERRVQLSGNQAAVDRVRHVAVEDLVLSQEDKPKRHRSTR